ncbi:DUF1604-domain-containing protein [Westerdykella ornata]|uniref:DUF1604-domain-containing protein n=1 Tax=Westerdykella ornata TaxID=318751 RepID=A0A6A6JIT7_WESOR|nr:DUF1604-domain-containing protein [Westerdykella ornata]KAF2276144.1 DUF1604-domain-containing protein [Westerdykella ornata]
MAYKRPRPPSPGAAQKRARGGAAASMIKLGTELPPDEDGDSGAFVPVWKQTVTDDRGRRRLHGAFTGGFSAGIRYFNTVGSKEGWTPKTFVSSRSDRKKDQGALAQRPEDFMDEEDLAEAAESRRLETAQDFATVGGSGVGTAKDDFFGLFMTQEETMGVKILQKMGWRRDQGIGRRVRRLAQLHDTDAGAEATTASAQHMFAPEDVPQMPLVPQDHRNGLGYQAEARLAKNEEEEEEIRTGPTLHFLEPTPKPQTQRKLPIKKTSFGVGVLNDTGSDEEDPYELGPKITFNKTIGKEKKAKKPSKFAKTGTGDKVVYVPKKAGSRISSDIVLRSRDGHPPLRGFVLATDILHSTKRRFPPPQIPPGWKSAKGNGAGTPAHEFQSVADAAKTSTLDAKTRAALLGETPLPTKSVFDYISKENRDRIAALTGKQDLPEGRGEGAPAGSKEEGQRSLWTFVPKLDKDIAAAALAKGATGWMPYSEDPKKRARYVAFLELRSGLRQELPERVPTMSVSDWVKELEEFAHAAQVFKPTSGIMASRFTSASSSSSAASGNGTAGDSLLRTPTTKPEDPAEQAAKLGMYGPMTRSQFPFHPTRLLCKRFNVAPPAHVPFAPESGVGDASVRAREAVSKPAMDELMHEYLTRGPMVQRPAWMTQQSEQPVPVSTSQHAPVDVENNEALSKERAPEEVFKSIFGDDDD